MIKISDFLLGLTSVVILASPSPLESRAGSVDLKNPFKVKIDYHCDARCHEKNLDLLVISQTNPDTKEMSGTTIHDFSTDDPDSTPNEEYPLAGKVWFNSGDDAAKQFYIARVERDPIKTVVNGVSSWTYGDLHYNCTIWIDKEPPYNALPASDFRLRVDIITASKNVAVSHVGPLAYQCVQSDILSCTTAANCPQ